MLVFGHTSPLADPLLAAPLSPVAAQAPGITPVPVGVPLAPIAMPALSTGPIVPTTMLRSPASLVATAYSPQPSPLATTSTPTFLDAVADLLDPAGAADSNVAPLTTPAPAPIADMALGAAGGIAPSPVTVGVANLVAAAPQTLAQVPAQLRAGIAPAEHVATTYAAGAGRKLKRAAASAKRKGSELWAGVRDPRRVHVTQVPSKYNTAPAAGNRDCGPASVVMALKLVGSKIPGLAAEAAPQRQIDRVRQLAQNTASHASTTNFQLERALRRAGAQVREVFDLASVRQAILSGRPVILNGNPRNSGAYGWRFSAREMHPFDGSHWMVVSGYDKSTGKFIVNDPLSKVGPVQVTPAELEAYRGGSLGIEVAA